MDGCLSAVDSRRQVKQILVGVQELLDNPNNSDAAQDAAYKLFKKSTLEYSKRWGILEYPPTSM